MNWAIVEIGQIAGARTAPAIARDSGSRPRVVSSRREAFAAAYEMERVHDPFKDMLADSDVGAVSSAHSCVVAAPKATASRWQ